MAKQTKIGKTIPQQIKDASAVRKLVIAAFTSNAIKPKRVTVETEMNGNINVAVFGTLRHERQAAEFSVYFKVCTEELGVFAVEYFLPEFDIKTVIPAVFYTEKDRSLKSTHRKIVNASHATIKHGEKVLAAAHVVNTHNINVALALDAIVADVGEEFGW